MKMAAMTHVEKARVSTGCAFELHVSSPVQGSNFEDAEKVKYICIYI